MTTEDDVLRFDACVALPEAQERFERAEAEVERLRKDHGVAVEVLGRVQDEREAVEAEIERLQQRGDAVVHAAREVMHGRMHSGELLHAMRAWEGKN